MAEKLILEQELNLSEVWADTTCIKNKIHYPIDWVLLRDATRTSNRFWLSGVMG